MRYSGRTLSRATESSRRNSTEFYDAKDKKPAGRREGTLRLGALEPAAKKDSGLRLGFITLGLVVGLALSIAWLRKASVEP